MKKLAVLSIILVGCSCSNAPIKQSVGTMGTHASTRITKTTQAKLGGPRRHDESAMDCYSRWDQWREINEGTYEEFLGAE